MSQFGFQIFQQTKAALKWPNHFLICISTVCLTGLDQGRKMNICESLLTTSELISIFEATEAV